MPFISGYYHANERFKDSSVDVFSQRIADSISNNTENGFCAILTVDNTRLSTLLSSSGEQTLRSWIKPRK
jgi:hypothetical protein